MVDETLDYAKILQDNTKEFDEFLSIFRQRITDVFGDGEEEKRNLILSYLDEAVIHWNNLKELQKILCNKMEQRSLYHSIEITGLPEEYGRTLSGVAQILSKSLRITITEYYIRDFKRIDELNDRNEIMYPRPLVVNLVNTNIKRRILTAAEMVTLKVPDSDVPIIIAELLTPLNKQLLKKAREEAARRGIAKVWVEHGNINFRRDDQSNIYEVRSDADIRAMSIV